jgi:hypothetical protein
MSDGADPMVAITFDGGELARIIRAVKRHMRHMERSAERLQGRRELAYARASANDAARYRALFGKLERFRHLSP